MKKTSLLLSIVVLTIASTTSLSLQAQPPNSLPVFTMLLTNGKTYNTVDLPRNKPVLLIYFAPDCEHCQVLLKEFFQKIAAFKTAQLLLVTFKPVPDLVAFEKSFQTQAYPNLHVGAETKPLYLQGLFNLQKTPFTALYDKKKNLLIAYKTDASVDDLIKRLRRLK